MYLRLIAETDARSVGDIQSFLLSYAADKHTLTDTHTQTDADEREYGGICVIGFRGDGRHWTRTFPGPRFHGGLIGL